jgi:hypothetical protein
MINGESERLGDLRFLNPRTANYKLSWRQEAGILSTSGEQQRVAEREGRREPRAKKQKSQKSKRAND